MANNPYVNKVNYGDQTVMDISDTTAEESDVAEGEVFYKGNGQRSVGTGNYYSPNDAAETALADTDYFPFYDTSVTGKRKTLWSNIKAKLKTYFDGIYSTFSGSYNDLEDKPTIPAAQVNSDWNANSGVAKILNKPSLATVATSGSYNDLSNKPTIPSVGNGTLTIQRNGTNVTTFTANQSGNATANISVPTNTWRGYQFLTKSASFSVSANSTTTVTFNGLNNVSGYTPIIAWPAYVDSSGKWQRIIALNFSNKVSNGSVAFNLLNMNTSSASGTFYVNVLYLQ